MSTCEHDRQDDVCWECKDDQIASLELDLAVVTAAKEHAEKRWGDQVDVAWQLTKKYDALKRELAAALARIAILEEEDREWDKHSLTQLVEERGELQERVAALTETIRLGLMAPSGIPICSCRNRNAVAAGMETPCWYCSVRDRVQDIASATGDDAAEYRDLVRIAKEAVAILDAAKETT